MRISDYPKWFANMEQSIAITNEMCIDETNSFIEEVNDSGDSRYTSIIMEVDSRLRAKHGNELKDIVSNKVADLLYCVYDHESKKFFAPADDPVYKIVETKL